MEKLINNFFELLYDYLPTSKAKIKVYWKKKYFLRRLLQARGPEPFRVKNIKNVEFSE